jgi:hypothetical protein
MTYSFFLQDSRYCSYIQAGFVALIKTKQGGRKALVLKNHPFAFSRLFPASQLYGFPAS